MAAIHLVLENMRFVNPAASAAGRFRMCSGAPKSAVQSAGNAREKACRQTLVVLQHDKLVRKASEL